MFGDYEHHKERLYSGKLKETKSSDVVGETDDNIKDGVVSLTGYRALNIRKFPSLDAAIIGTLYDGDILTIYETESTGTFYKIRTARGVEGYSLREQIKMKN